MTRDQFWEIIEGVHRDAQSDMDTKCELLQERLSALELPEIVSFRDHFDDCDQRAYQWGLWGAAYIIHGGCSDDSFTDFRSSLISLGREVFEKALIDPDSLASLNLDEEDACYEGYAYALTEVEEAVGVGADGSAGSSSFPSEPTGEPWDEDDDRELARRYPRLHKLYNS